MDEKLERKKLRRNFSTLGWALVLYSAIMNLCVIVVCVVDAVARVLAAGPDRADIMAIVQDSLQNNGWGYVLTVAVGLFILRMWKGKDFCRRELWTCGAPMDVGSFLALVCLFLSIQLVTQFTAAFQESMLNSFGFSAMGALEAASGTANTFSMFLYMSILAPITEELLFRGLILRTLMPYGKGFAILMSALLFGIFHGNLIQTPHAFCVGLILGYTAAEYSVAWAMVLHMINNLLLADMLTRLTSGLPAGAADSLFFLIVTACFIAAVIILLCRRKQVGAYIRENPLEERPVASFLTAPGILVITAMKLIDMLLTIQPL